MDNARKRATVKLIPRIDLQAMAEKFVIRLIYNMFSSFLVKDFVLKCHDLK